MDFILDHENRIIFLFIYRLSLVIEKSIKNRIGID